MQAGGLTALAAAVYGAGALGQQATTSGNDIEGLLFQAGGVGVALGVGWWMIRRSDSREDRAAAAAAALLTAEKEAHEHTRAQLIEETARRMAAERLIDRRDRGDTRPEEHHGSTEDLHR